MRIIESRMGMLGNRALVVVSKQGAGGGECAECEYVSKRTEKN